MGIADKIREIEAEIGRTQRNKRTEYHLGLLKAKLAKYRSELLESANKAGKAKMEGFEVEKTGDARVAMIGFPSVGKSTLMGRLTTTESAVAAYDFTTLTCVPGVIEHANGARIQLLDLPGIISGAAVGKGRGRQVVAISRTADLILMLLDASKEDRGERQKEKLTAELETMGLRLNKQRPDIHLKVKSAGGIVLTAAVSGGRGLTHLDVNIVRDVLAVYKIHDAEVVVRCDATVDDLIDTVESAKRVYVPCLYVYNKVDELTIEELDELANKDHAVVVSGAMGLNMDYLLERVWDELQLVRVETCGCTDGYAKESTEIQNIQVAEGDVARGIPIRLHMVFPRMFTCPSVASRTFKVEFEVNIVVMLEDNHVITEGFPITLVRYP